MRIQKLHLKNFRNIEEHTFEFPAMFSVVIGKNGSGKSAILHALRVAAGAYFLGLNGVARRHIDNDEIRQFSKATGYRTKQWPVIVRATGMLDGATEPLTWQRQIRENSTTTTSSTQEIGKIKEIAQQKYQNHQAPDYTAPLHLPVIAYFGTGRLHGASRWRNGNNDIGRRVLEHGYRNWKDMRSSTYGYLRWLLDYEADLYNEQQRYERGERLEAPLDMRPVFWEAVNKACGNRIEEYRTMGAELAVAVSFYPELGVVPMSMHSDGVRVYVEMVAEIAYRCITLNAELGTEAIRASKGLVLIDELDIHLHPAWQKTVAQSLKDAFPNLQFVITTHSPFIVQSVEGEELINLEEVLGGHRSEINNPTNHSIEEIAKEEMVVEDVERSQKFTEMMQLVEDYAALVQAGKSSATDEETASIQQQLNQLEEVYADNPAFVAVLKMKRLSEQL